MRVHGRPRFRREPRGLGRAAAHGVEHRHVVAGGVHLAAALLVIGDQLLVDLGHALAVGTGLLPEPPPQEDEQGDDCGRAELVRQGLRPAPRRELWCGNCTAVVPVAVALTVYAQARYWAHSYLTQGRW